MKNIFFAFVFCVLLSEPNLCNAAAPKLSIHLINNQEYPIRLPVTIRDVRLPAAGSMDDQPVQQDGSNIVFVADVSAKSEKEISFSAAESTSRKILSVAAVENGIAFSLDGKNAGQLTWDVVVEPAKKRSAESEIVSTKRDYAKAFQAIPFSFEKKSSGEVFNTWSAKNTKSGLSLFIELKIYHEGFVDVTARITNEFAPTSNVSAALVTRWDHPPLENRTLCYDNRRNEFGASATTDFHEKEGRFWHIQHGVDWVRSQIKNGPSVVWLNPFDPVFTVRAEATEKSPVRYMVGSEAQFGREAQSIPGALFSITEIARPNIKSYRDRVRENVLPPKGESFEITTRFAFQKSGVSDDVADQMFLGTTSYREEHFDNGKAELVFGVKSVRFGTSYFPYSTFGENFDTYKLPGMDREGFWPLAADTVNQWPLFADEIRRDLRLAKWMGFKLIRLHHFELLAPIDKKIRQEYLDFLFNEMRHLKLLALLDIYASPQQIEELLKRYGDVIDGIEIENEILIWNLPATKTNEWKEIYDTVKNVAPHVKVNLTAQNNTGIFDRLAQLGVGFDRIGLHSYVDTLDALPSARGWALAAGDYGTRIGKPPTVTEWNFRGLTRMSPENRAKIYPQIFEGALATRSIPEFYQFQFQETLAPNPVIGRGNLLRHYEMFNLSRHPKMEALEFAKIIQRYSAENDPTRILDVDYAEVDLEKNGNGKATLNVSNRSDMPLKLNAVIETPKDLKLEITGSTKLSIAPRETKKVPFTLTVLGGKPGFYHGFIRLEGENNFLRYAAIEARLTGIPQLQFKNQDEVQYSREIAEGSVGFLTNIAAVVYGQDAPVVEVETAIAIAQTLESATGKLVPYFQLYDLPTEARASGNLILVGTAKTHALIQEVESKIPSGKASVICVERPPSPRPSPPGEGEKIRAAKGKNTEWLVISGPDSDSAKGAGMDFILRYWKTAKDSASGKVGLVQKKLPRGIDPAKLP
ncbi:MAG: hypothetical protein M3Y82_11555 [Verrucomicrobiota bacterium]|nr:hypothetical protein [Verrucomicrobiota bacterium]